MATRYRAGARFSLGMPDGTTLPVQGTHLDAEGNLVDGDLIPQAFVDANQYQIDAWLKVGTVVAVDE
jgi:hypothetical protein